MNDQRQQVGRFVPVSRSDVLPQYVEWVVVFLIMQPVTPQSSLVKSVLLAIKHGHLGHARVSLAPVLSGVAIL